MPRIDDPRIVGALIAFAGVFIGALSSWILAFINRRFDDRRHLREIAIKAALSYWEGDIEIAKLRREITNRAQRVAPLDSYIIHMLQLAESISSRRLDENNVAQELRRIRRISRSAAQSAREQPDQT